MTGIQVWRHPHGRAPPARLRASAWLKNYAAGEIVADGIIQHQCIEKERLPQAYSNARELGRCTRQPCRRRDSRPGLSY